VIARVAAAVAVCALVGVAHAQPARLRPDEVTGGVIEPEPPSIDLLTFGVGARIFEKFGHAAICLRYHEPDHPTVCFNYGVTNFDAGAIMVWNFLRSKQRFWVEPTSLKSMVWFYEHEDRDIWVQPLPITGERARALEARLWRNLQEENRYYNYDHFLDNCATRLRDMIDQATGGALRAATETPYPLTFREIGRRGLAGLPLLVLASDIVTGRQLDEHPTVWHAMFHPDVLRKEVEVVLGVPPQRLYARQGPAFPTDGPSGRVELLAASLVFVLPLLLAQWRRRFETAAVAWVALELVVLGLMVWGLVAVSPIAGVRFNELVLVVTPLDAVLPLLAADRRRRYARVRVVLLAMVSLLAAVGVLHQPLWALIAVVFLPMLTIALDLPRGLTSPSPRAG
jgi:uncharacterized membrane protein